MTDPRAALHKFQSALVFGGSLIQNSKCAPIRPRTAGPHFPVGIQYPRIEWGNANVMGMKTMAMVGLWVVVLGMEVGMADGRSHGCDRDCVCDGVDLSRLKGQMWWMPEIVGDPEGRQVRPPWAERAPCHLTAVILTGSILFALGCRGPTVLHGERRVATTGITASQCASRSRGTGSR
eukprot:COSAG02_NODE_609_length_19574_cov_18.178537_7_plen_178_part_00